MLGRKKAGRLALFVVFVFPVNKVQAADKTPCAVTTEFVKHRAPSHAKELSNQKSAPFPMLSMSEIDEYCTGKRAMALSGLIALFCCFVIPGFVSPDVGAGNMHPQVTLLDMRA